METNTARRRRLKRAALSLVMQNPAGVTLAALCYLLPTMLINIILNGMALTPAQLTLVYPLLTVLNLLITAPLMLGLFQYLMKMIRRQPLHIGEMFRYLESPRLLWRSIRFALCLDVRMLWGAAYLAIILGWAFFMPETAYDTIIALVLGAIGVPVFAKCVSYYAAAPLYADDDSLGAWKTLGAASRLFKGRLFELISALVSFLPWLLASALTYGALMVFVLPYMLTTLCLFVEEAQRKDEPERPDPYPPTL